MYFDEEYIVKFNYLKPDGFWEIKTEEVYVKVKHGVNEKNNHQKACDILKLKYPNAEIISCTYC